jgi:hypothetical protein
MRGFKYLKTIINILLKKEIKSKLNSGDAFTIQLNFPRSPMQTSKDIF